LDLGALLRMGLKGRREKRWTQVGLVFSFYEAVFGLGNLLAVRLRGKGEEKGYLTCRLRSRFLGERWSQGSN
jgi:hypothetical protein